MSRRADKKAASREYFDRNAASYEHGRRWRFLREPRTEALALLELGAGDRLLDVGCGTGAVAREAAPLVTRAVGLDLSPQMIAEARRLAEDLPSAEFETGDAEHLPFAADEFTAVLCTTSIHHYPHPAQAIAEMARVLAPGGRLVIGDSNRDRLATRVHDFLLRHLQPSHVRILSSTELTSFLTEAGLEPVASTSLWRGRYMIALARKP